VKPVKPAVLGPFVVPWSAPTMTLTCSTVTTEANGNTFTFTWFKDDVTLSGEVGSTLTRSSMAVSDNGVYTCSVTYKGVTSDVSADHTITVCGECGGKQQQQQQQQTNKQTNKQTKNIYFKQQGNFFSYTSLKEH
jgi:hypothetical protein